jgi:ubiquinone/menaquinone biosynthesis C-methylase UbiE
MNRKPTQPPKPAPKQKTDWSNVAEWYDGLVGSEGSEYQREVVFPGVLRLLGDPKGQRILDVACGQGALCRILKAKGANVVGVDAAGPLIDAARKHSLDDAITYYRADARELAENAALRAEPFDAATCVLAIQNIHPIAPVFEAAHRLLRPGGRFIVVMMHPAFRGAKESHWGWDEAAAVQFRRVDRYLIPRKSPIYANPGKKDGNYTWTFHKPIGDYVAVAAKAGLLTDALEEWPSHKASQPGPRAAAENTARKEIPMFMALRCVKH